MTPFTFLVMTASQKPFLLFLFFYGHLRRDLQDTRFCFLILKSSSFCFLILKSSSSQIPGQVLNIQREMVAQEYVDIFDNRFVIKVYNAGTARWKRGKGQGLGERGRSFQAPPPSLPISACSSTWKPPHFILFFHMCFIFIFQIFKFSMVIIVCVKLLKRNSLDYAP